MSRREIECSDRATTVGSTIAAIITCATIATMGPRSCVRHALRGRWLPLAVRRAGAARRKPDPLARRRRSTARAIRRRRSTAARLARLPPARVVGRGSIMGRTRLERFRQTPAAAELDEARARSPRRRSRARSTPASASSCRSASASSSTSTITSAPPRSCSTRSSTRPRARARCARARARLVGHGARPAGAVAADSPTASRSITRIGDRMERGARRDPASAPATYWLAASARAPAISIAPGRPRPRAGSAPRSPRSRRRAARRSSIGCDRRRSFRSGPRGCLSRDRRQATDDDDGRLGSVQEELVVDSRRMLRSRRSRQLFASFQFSPMPTSTVSGTPSSTADSIRSRTAATVRRRAPPAPRTAARRARSGSSARVAAARGERGVDVDHRALQDVGGGALDRHVDGHRARRPRASGSCGCSAPAPAAAGRTSSSRRRCARASSSVRSMKRADAREAGEVGVDELLRRLRRDADVLRQRERGLSVEQRVVDHLRACGAARAGPGRCRRRTPSAPSDRGCRRRARNASISVSSPARCARTRSSICE